MACSRPTSGTVDGSFRVVHAAPAPERCGGKATFRRARRPYRDDLVKLLDTLSRRIVRVLERRGLLIAASEHPSLELEMDSSLDQIQAASINYRIAIGPHAGRKALTLYSVPPLDEEPHIHLLARLYGFSLHAGTVCETYQRSKLERLCRYIALQGCRVLRRLGTIASAPAHPSLPNGCPWTARAGWCTGTNARSGTDRLILYWSHWTLCSG